jgi:hypothetical protein
MMKPGHSCPAFFISMRAGKRIITAVITDNYRKIYGLVFKNGGSTFMARSILNCYEK